MQKIEKIDKNLKTNKQTNKRYYNYNVQNKLYSYY